ncbi:MAG: hypothetical protein ACREVJ_16775, partial [Gammaproteobacteria bacterium]
MNALSGLCDAILDAPSLCGGAAVAFETVPRLGVAEWRYNGPSIPRRALRVCPCRRALHDCRLNGNLAMKQQAVCVYLGEALGRYGFGGGHPFDAGRMRSFEEGATSAGVLGRVERREPAIADRATIERFHTSAYVERVVRQSKTGEGYLDYGDTPAFPGAFDAAAAVVGSTVDAVHRLMLGDFRRAFVPIAGLHHARRDRAGGFCVFNDCGVAIEVLKADY